MIKKKKKDLYNWDRIFRTLTLRDADLEMICRRCDYFQDWYEFFFFQAEDGIRDPLVTEVQTCALPIYGTRANALWGSRREMRGNALWGRGGRRSAILVAFCLLLTSAVANGSAALGGSGSAFVPQRLLDAATANPDAVFRVVVQGERGKSSNNVASDVQAAQTEVPGKASGLK